MSSLARGVLIMLCELDAEPLLCDSIFEILREYRGEI